MWQDYSQWESDVETGRSRDLRNLEQSFKLGRGISAEGYAAGTAKINREADEKIAVLQAGPTYKMLRENWQAKTGGSGSMMDFYGAAQTTSVVEEGAPSPKRGPDVAAAAAAEGGEFGLLERQKQSWYFV